MLVYNYLSRIYHRYQIRRRKMLALKSVIHGKKGKMSYVGAQLASESSVVFSTHLKDKEYVYLNAAELGEYSVVRSLLEDEDVNPDCVDYMGRNALLLAMKSESLQLLDLLIEKLSFFMVEDALLNAICSERIHMVKMIVDHPFYIKKEKSCAVLRAKSTAARKRKDRSQFSADITPIMLAAHINNHEIIQMLLDRGHNLEMPHDRACQCERCEKQREDDSLMLEVQRLHTYQALASPAYLSLTTSDPVQTAYLLRNELYTLAQQEKQFKEEYTSLARLCMTFAVDCLDLCRTSDEVETLLIGKGVRRGRIVRDPLATVKLAMQCKEKKFVAHPNCQHQLETIFYHHMINIRDMKGPQLLGFFLAMVVYSPVLYILYTIYPNLYVPVPQGQSLFKCSKIRIKDFLRCPVIQFLGHMTSYMTFLVLITVATFRLDQVAENLSKETWDVKATAIFRYDFRLNSNVLGAVQWILMFWIVGQMLMECKLLYHFGPQGYFRNFYNIMDAIALGIYLASYTLRIVVSIKLSSHAFQFENQIRTAKAILQNETHFWSEGLPYFKFRDSLFEMDGGYWLRGCRLWWHKTDPETVSDCLFAVANVVSFARVTYLMPASELLGPLQISLARMVSDIVRFMVLFIMVAFAFVVGITNLYWYFGSFISNLKVPNTTSIEILGKQTHIVYKSGITSFQSIGRTFFTLYWALFGLSPTDSTLIKGDSDYPGHNNLIQRDSTNLVTMVGTTLFAVYNAAMIIILINMLIAMMSKSFDEIQVGRLEEWKYARTELWMVYIEHEGTLPVPYNILPHRDFIYRIFRRFATKIGVCKPKIKRQREVIIRDPKKAQKKSNSKLQELDEETQEAMRRRKGFMIRRYLFKLQKLKEEENKTGDLANTQYQRQLYAEEKAAKVESESKSEGGEAKPPSASTLNTLLMPPSMRRQLEEKADEEVMEEVRHEKVAQQTDAMKEEAANAFNKLQNAALQEAIKEKESFKPHTEAMDDHRRCSLLKELQTVDDEMRIFCDAAISSCDSIASSENTDDYYI